MTEIREQPPTEAHRVDWVLYQTPARFAELAASNAGVVLEPLASGEPVEKMDSRVVQGMSALSRDVVTSIVVDHSEMPETAFLLGRYREITDRAKLRSLPLAGDEQPKTRIARERQKPNPLETAKRMIFGPDGKPKIDKVRLVVARNPIDPETVDAIDTAFLDAGLDLDEAANAELRKEVEVAAMSGYDRYVLGERSRTEPIALDRMIVSWISSFDDSNSQFSSGMREMVIKRAIGSLDPTNNNFDACVATMNKALSAMADLRSSRRIESREERFAKVVGSDISRTFFKRLRAYPRGQSVELLIADDTPSGPMQPEESRLRSLIHHMLHNPLDEVDSLLTKKAIPTF